MTCATNAGGLTYDLDAKPWHHFIGYPLMRVDSVDAIYRYTDEQAAHLIPSIALTLLGFAPWGAYDEYWTLFFVSGRDRRVLAALSPDFSSSDNLMISHMKRFDALKERLTAPQREVLAEFCRMYFGEIVVPARPEVASAAATEWTT